jgi:hypothetical protein
VDWVREWNNSKPKPKVRLWDKSKLEKYLSERPEVVARFFSRALSPQGRLEFVRSQFWNYLQYADTALLKVLWRERENLEWNSQRMAAVILSEASNGDFGERAWGATLDETDLCEVFALVLVNGPYLITRVDQMGSDAQGYVEALSYLLLNLLTRLKVDATANLLERVWECRSDGKLPKELQGFFVEPMVARLEAELFDVCQSDCHRVNTDLRILSNNQVKNYWDRLRVHESTLTEDEAVFFLEGKNLPCKVGFEMTEGRGCPYLGQIEKDIAKRLQKLHDTIKFRRKQANQAR